MANDAELDQPRMDKMLQSIKWRAKIKGNLPMTRTDLQNLIDQALLLNRITAADAATLQADMRNAFMSVATILAAANAAIQTKATADGVQKSDVDAQLAAAIGLSTTL
jgi:hypothetical protein